MQTVSGVTKNLWRRRQSGLYAPTRRNFPIDGLSLYAPLWHPELSGSPFLSKDLNAHTVTVTQATWGITGRTFDGVDDKIVIPNHASFNGFTSGLSIVKWVYINPLATNMDGVVKTLVDKDAGSGGYTIYWDDRGGTNGTNGVFANCLFTYAPYIYRVGVDSTITAAGWYLIVFTYLIGGGAAGSILYIGTPTTAPSVKNTAAAGTDYLEHDHNLYLNARSNDTNYAQVIDGEDWLYKDRVLTLPEIKNMWNATRWRYM